jgi:hypothetical protein
MEAIEQYGIVFVFILVMLGSSLIGQYMSAAISAIIWLFSAVFGV